MIHVDLYSGIGGFALAAQWAEIETVCFCEIDKFCQKVLRTHWPGVPIVEDVNEVEEIQRIVANAAERRSQRCCQSVTLHSAANGDRRGESSRGDTRDAILLTAGFPCQPFSCAGRRRGKADDRYLWPQTLKVIEAVRPDWCLLENVAGILNMVFPDSESAVASQAALFGVPDDQIAEYDTIVGGIDRDLRSAGYETLWLVIPACSLGAPHRRDRVWILACNTTGNGCLSRGNHIRGRQVLDPTIGQTEANQQAGDRWLVEVSQGDSDASNATGREEHATGTGGFHTMPCSQDSHAPDTGIEGLAVRPKPADRRGTLWHEGQAVSQDNPIPGWQEDWYEVATRFCGVDAGIPDRVDRLKSLGNAIVPQIAYQIIMAIVEAEEEWDCLK